MTTAKRLTAVQDKTASKITIKPKTTPALTRRERLSQSSERLRDLESARYRSKIEVLGETGYMVKLVRG